MSEVEREGRRQLNRAIVNYARDMVARYHVDGVPTPLNADIVQFLIFNAKVVGGWDIATGYGRMLAAAAFNGRHVPMPDVLAQFLLRPIVGAADVVEAYAAATVALTEAGLATSLSGRVLDSMPPELADRYAAATVALVEAGLAITLPDRVLDSMPPELVDRYRAAAVVCVEAGTAINMPGRVLDSMPPELVDRYAAAAVAVAKKGTMISLPVAVHQRLGAEQNGEFVRAVASGGALLPIACEAMQGAPDDAVGLMMAALTESIGRYKKPKIQQDLVRRATNQQRRALAGALRAHERSPDALKVLQWNHWRGIYDGKGRKELRALISQNDPPMTESARTAILSIQKRHCDLQGTRRQAPTQQTKFDRNLDILKQFMKDNGGTLPASRVTVDVSGEQVPIGSWCCQRRNAKKRGGLTDAQTEALETIKGWWW